ncbi:MAG: hypothetical protein ACT4PP_06050 [Sporichthyaceae bacterium]
MLRPDWPPSPPRWVLPSPWPSGLYRLYLNFAHAGVIRTAEFTLDVPVGSAALAAPSAPQTEPAQPRSAEPAGEHSGH